jgi:dimethylamine/trimethylamine dehydrogenase
VIVAAGARYSAGRRSIVRDADIPGCSLPHVLVPEDILIRGARPQGRIVILDAEGYHTGAGLAERLAGEGADVRFVFPGHAPISARNTDNWEERYLVARMKRAGVALQPTTWVAAIRSDEVVLYDTHTGEERAEAVDAVILATGREPQDTIARALEGRVPQLYTIGDALAARMFAAATFEGQKFARLIGEAGAPASVGEAWFVPDPPGTTPLPADLARRG